MNKTKTIDVWVPIVVKGGFMVYQAPLDVAKEMSDHRNDFMKATLTIELPERKKMLTESEVRDLLKKYVFHELSTEDMDDDLDKLFGEQE